MAYRKCPRCNLNYIKDVDALCMVCMEDLGKSSRLSTDDEDYDICPECGDNVIKSGEEMCHQCQLERTKDTVDEVVKKSTQWGEITPGVEVTDTFHVDLEEEMGELEKVDLDEEEEEEDEDAEIIPDSDDDQD